MTDPVDPALLQRAHENFYEAWRVLTRPLHGSAIEEGDGLLCTSSGMPLAFFNSAFVTRPITDFGAALDRAVRFYARRGMPWILRAGAPVSPELAESAAAVGLLPSTALPGMLLAPLAGEPRPVPGLEIRVVEDLPTLRIFNEVSDAGFGMPPFVTEAMTVPGLLEAPDLTLYLGYVEGRPAATSMRFSSHQIAGVYTVATLAEYRGRGLGEAMTWRAALDGLSEGCIAASLQASQMGSPIYARMGFRHVADYATWDGV